MGADVEGGLRMHRWNESAMTPVEDLRGYTQSYSQSWHKMLRLTLQSATCKWGTLTLVTVRMDGTSSPDPGTTPFGARMPILVLQLASLSRGTGCVYSVGHSPDGRHVVSGSHDRTIRIWNAENGIVVSKSLVGRADFVRYVAHSPGAFDLM